MFSNKAKQQKKLELTSLLKFPLPLLPPYRQSDTSDLSLLTTSFPYFTFPILSSILSSYPPISFSLTVPFTLSNLLSSLFSMFPSNFHSHRYFHSSILYTFADLQRNSDSEPKNHSIAVLFDFVFWRFRFAFSFSNLNFE